VFGNLHPVHCFNTELRERLVRSLFLLLIGSSGLNTDSHKVCLLLKFNQGFHTLSLIFKQADLFINKQYEKYCPHFWFLILLSC
jgi:hypothetical protein